MSSELIDLKLRAALDAAVEQHMPVMVVTTDYLSAVADHMLRLLAELAEAREVPGRIVEWLRDEGTLQIDTGYDAGIYGGQGMLFAAAQIEARDWSKP